MPKPRPVGGEQPQLADRGTREHQAGAAAGGPQGVAAEVAVAADRPPAALPARGRSARRTRPAPTTHCVAGAVHRARGEAVPTRRAGVTSSKRPPAQGIARSLSRHSKVEPGSLLLIRIGTLLAVTTGWVGVCSSYAVLVTKTNGVDVSWVQAMSRASGRGRGCRPPCPAPAGCRGCGRRRRGRPRGPGRRTSRPAARRSVTGLVHARQSCACAGPARVHSRPKGPVSPSVTCAPTVKVIVDAARKPAALGVVEAASVVSGGVESSQPSESGSPGIGPGGGVSTRQPGVAAAGRGAERHERPGQQREQASRTAVRCRCMVPPGRRSCGSNEARASRSRASGRRGRATTAAPRGRP